MGHHGYLTDVGWQDPDPISALILTLYRANADRVDRHEAFKQCSALVRSAPAPLGLPTRSLSPALNPFSCIQIDAGRSLQMQAACGC